MGSTPRLLHVVLQTAQPQAVRWALAGPPLPDPMRVLVGA